MSSCLYCSRSFAPVVSRLYCASCDACFCLGCAASKRDEGHVVSLITSDSEREAAPRGLFVPEPLHSPSDEDAGNDAPNDYDGAIPGATERDAELDDGLFRSPSRRRAAAAGVAAAVAAVGGGAPWQRNYTCGECGDEGHNTRSCPLRGQRKRVRGPSGDPRVSGWAGIRLCSVCGLDGHDRRTCPSRQGPSSPTQGPVPPSMTVSSGQPTPPAALVAVFNGPPLRRPSVPTRPLGEGDFDEAQLVAALKRGSSFTAAAAVGSGIDREYEEGMVPKRKKARHCRECGSAMHDVRTCPTKPK